MWPTSVAEGVVDRLSFDVEDGPGSTSEEGVEMRHAIRGRDEVVGLRAEVVGFRSALAGLRSALAGTALLAAACSSSATAPDPSGGGLELVADGLDAPLLVTYAPGDTERIFVVEQTGRIRVVRNGTLLTEPFLDIASQTSTGGERGLLGLAFHPAYAANGFFFVNHTDANGDTRIVRFFAGASADRADASSLEVVLVVPQPFGNHNGGHLAFGPDGMLYVGMGDGGSGGDPLGHGQNRATLLGSMLRMDVDALPYSIPPDNPFVADATAAPETWAYGLRNPWRFSFDRTLGDLWIADVGQNRLEEVSFQPAASTGGENYGWARLEGSDCFATDPCDATGTVLPVYEYATADGCAITGGYRYRGSAIPAFQGLYFFGDFCTGRIRSIPSPDARPGDAFDHSDAFGTVPGLSSFGEDAAGELYVVSINGQVYRIVDPG
jgi:glucose/arabinose dehydrogenase